MERPKAAEPVHAPGVVSGIINNLHGNKVTVHLLGGDLLVEWSGKETDPVYMTGPAKIAFKGSVEID